MVHLGARPSSQDDPGSRDVADNVGRDDRGVARDADTVGPGSGTSAPTVCWGTVAEACKVRGEEGVEGGVAGRVNVVVGDRDVSASASTLCDSLERLVSAFKSESGPTLTIDVHDGKASRAVSLDILEQLGIALLAAEPNQRVRSFQLPEMVPPAIDV